MTRLAAVVYSVDNHAWTEVVLNYLGRATSTASEIVVVDNGSDPPFPESWGHRHVRYEENVGGNAIMHRALTDGWWGQDQIPEFLAFLHCDLIIHEKDWDVRVVDAFDKDPKLNLIGFAGSNQIDDRGGRGGGTMLNFAGEFVPGMGQGSPTGHHGRHITGLHAAAVIDHLAMIFRTSELRELTPQEGNYAPEHFYDRIMSCEVLERGGHVAVLGIRVDHFSGGTGPGVAKAEALRKRWLEAEGLPFNPQTNHTDVYLESERRFKERYMKTKFAPLWVGDDYTIRR